MLQLLREQSLQLRVFDMGGRMALQRNISGLEGENSLFVELGDLQAGLYILDVWTGELHVQKRLVIQR